MDKVNRGVLTPLDISQPHTLFWDMNTSPQGATDPGDNVTSLVDKSPSATVTTISANHPTAAPSDVGLNGKGSIYCPASGNYVQDAIGTLTPPYWVWVVFRMVRLWGPAGNTYVFDSSNSGDRCYLRYTDNNTAQERHLGNFNVNAGGTQKNITGATADFLWHFMALNVPIADDSTVWWDNQASESLAIGNGDFDYLTLGSAYTGSNDADCRFAGFGCGAGTLIVNDIAILRGWATSTLGIYKSPISMFHGEDYLGRVWWNSRELVPIGNDLLFGGHESKTRYVAAFRHNSDRSWDFFLQFSSWFDGQPDDHNNPSFLRLPDGDLIASYTKHGDDDDIYLRKTTGANSDDPTSMSDWDVNETTLTGAVAPEPNITYAPLRYVKSEDVVYLFARSENYDTCMFRTDTDLVEDAGGYVHLINVGGPTQRGYTAVGQRGSEDLHFCYSSRHPTGAAGAPSDLWHMYYDPADTTFKQSDGTTIATMTTVESTPIDYDEGSKLYTYKATAYSGEDQHDYIRWGHVHPWRVEVDPDTGYPVFVFQVWSRTKSDTTEYNISTEIDDHRIFYYRSWWNGSVWQKKCIMSAGSAIVDNGSATPHYSGGITIDPDNLDVMYASSNAADPSDVDSWFHNNNVYIEDIDKNANGICEMYRGVWNSVSETVTWTAITSQSDKHQFRPAKAKNALMADAFTWLYGAFPDFNSYQSAYMLKDDTITKWPVTFKSVAGLSGVLVDWHLINTTATDQHDLPPCPIGGSQTYRVRRSAATHEAMKIESSSGADSVTIELDPGGEGEYDEITVTGPTQAVVVELAREAANLLTGLGVWWEGDSVDDAHNTPGVVLTPNGAVGGEVNQTATGGQTGCLYLDVEKRFTITNATTGFNLLLPDATTGIQISMWVYQTNLAQRAHPISLNLDPYYVRITGSGDSPANVPRLYLDGLIHNHTTALAGNKWECMQLNAAIVGANLVVKGKVDGETPVEIYSSADTAIGDSSSEDASFASLNAAAGSNYFQGYIRNLVVAQRAWDDDEMAEYYALGEGGSYPG